MKCQKCAKPAVVHLTEIVTAPDATGAGETKRAVEIHLCLNHAVEAGLLSPVQQQAQPVIVPKKSIQVEEPETSAIVPAPSEPTGLAVRRERAADASLCPHCGISWAAFKQSGLMGCPHDYEHFQLRLLPLVKRAHEGATDHIGKVPARRKTVEGDRQLQSLRLQKQLRTAIDAENYEQAAQLRDQLKNLTS